METAVTNSPMPDMIIAVLALAPSSLDALLASRAWICRQQKQRQQQAPGDTGTQGAKGADPHGAGSRMSVQGRRVMVAAAGSAPQCRGAALAAPTNGRLQDGRLWDHGHGVLGASVDSQVSSNSSHANRSAFGSGIRPGAPPAHPTTAWRHPPRSPADPGCGTIPGRSADAGGRREVTSSGRGEALPQQILHCQRCACSCPPGGGVRMKSMTRGPLWWS